MQCWDTTQETGEQRSYEKRYSIHYWVTCYIFQATGQAASTQLAWYENLYVWLIVASWSPSQFFTMSDIFETSQQMLRAINNTYQYIHGVILLDGCLQPSTSAHCPPRRVKHGASLQAQPAKPSQLMLEKMLRLRKKTQKCHLFQGVDHWKTWLIEGY